MPSSCMTRLSSSFFMSILKRVVLKSSSFFLSSVASASNWQWLKTGTLAAPRTSSCSPVPPFTSAALRARCHMRSETKPTSHSPFERAFITSTSPRAVSPCFPRSRSKKVTSNVFKGTSEDFRNWKGKMQACGESRVPAARRLPWRSARLWMPAFLRTMMCVTKPQSTSRMPNDLLVPFVRFCVRTCARGPFQAMSMWPASNASTCRS
mmetsp:Transcript_54688/g.175412  ORF Transcript_54688/g.175412 Transcript_54688/m.175412 type:complete len:208 (-) Transcript_54688:218-841(-)